jgi:hypothetical protein
MSLYVKTNVCNSTTILINIPQKWEDVISPFVKENNI